MNILIEDVFKICLLLIPLLLAVAYLVLVERKIIGYIQLRKGPNRVGLFGFGQPIADAVKLFCKEMIIPAQANKYLFLCAPILAIAPALAAWAVIPFDPNWVIANISAGLLYLYAMSSLAVYSILIAGWASNSKYALFGALRAAAQTISYEIAMGFAFVGVLMLNNTANLQEIILKQQGGIWHWNIFPLFPLAVIYWISAMAETNRLPFDVVEGESELVAGFHVEYSGMAFALFFLAEYANMILVSAIASLLFLGGWLSPFENIPVLYDVFKNIPGVIWFLLKTGCFLFLYVWLRATLPRYRYDQIMRLGWKVLIPVALVWLIILAVAIQGGIL